MSEAQEEASWYWETVVSCHSEILDLFTYHLFEAATEGTEELSQKGSQVELKLYFKGGSVNPSSVVDAIRREMNVADDRIRLLDSQKKKMENWQANWKKHFKPLEIGKNFVVLPPWEESKSSKKQIVIQPGFGFGTGYHESTNLALQLLEWIVAGQPLGDVLDVGTGSGILAIASLLLEADNVQAIDIDPEAVAEVSNNLELSGFKPGQCRIEVSDPTSLQAGPFNLVLANIEDHILTGLASDLIRLTEPGGKLLLSGILTERKTGLLAAFDGLRMIKEMAINEWTGLILQKD